MVYHTYIYNYMYTYLLDMHMHVKTDHFLLKSYGSPRPQQVSRPAARYSFCNPKRFKRNCFTEPAAVPFFEMSVLATAMSSAYFPMIGWCYNQFAAKILVLIKGSLDQTHPFAHIFSIFRSLAPHQILTQAFAFFGVGKFIAERRPRLVILENVT